MRTKRPRGIIAVNNKLNSRIDIMLVIMFWVSGSGSTMDESTLYFIVLGFLPMIHIAYGYLVWAMSADQNM